MAIKEMKEHLKVNESAGSSMGRSQDITPTPQHSIEKDLQMQIMQLKATNQQVERGGEEGVGRKGGGRRKHNKVFKIHSPIQRIVFVAYSRYMSVYQKATYQVWIRMQISMKSR